MTRALLLMLNWLAHLEAGAVQACGGRGARRILLVAAGCSCQKATREIHDNVEHPGEDEAEAQSRARVSLLNVVAQALAVLDIVFSLDSVITAVGMADHVEVMVTAIVLAILVMLLFARRIGDFVERNPSVKVLALSFLVLIGATLVMEGTGQHVAKGYVYSAMAFSLVVQVLNLRRDRKVERSKGDPD
ncbi:MAG: TerC family protein [Myxococcota bacterium]